MRWNVSLTPSSVLGGMIVCCVLGVCQDPGRRIFAEEDRYSAELSDGSRISGGQMQNWNDPKQRPALEGRAVFDEKNPFRWLIDHSLSPAAQPEAFVEFFGGDRLPGEVVEFRTGQESEFLTWPKHLIVNPTVPLHSPRVPQNAPVRVRTRWIKRVVWEPRTLDFYQPSTVFLKDGRQIGFRSLRWAGKAVTLLLEEGIQEFPFGDVREIHLPLPDVWAMYYEQMAVLSPQSAMTTENPARIVQLETTDGLKATVSTERLQPFVHGNKNKTESWHHQCQPAWSLDPFWVRFDSVWTRRFFWPHQIPLTNIAPASVRQKSPLGNSWYWQRDRNVYRQPLQSGGKDYGWGFGVHAEHEMVFPLPSSARGFRTRAGLDQSVGDGGCVKWQVALRGAETKTLYQSKVVIGTNQVLDTGRLNLGPSPEENETRQLVLSVDPLLSAAPAGADPLDIRDSLDWLEPELELDREQLRQEIARHALSQIPALADWELETDAVVLGNQWDEYDRQDPRYRELLGSPGRFCSLRKSFSVGTQDRWLVLAVNRTDDKAPPVRLLVQMDGAVIADLEIPAARDAKGPDPLLVPLKDYRGRTVNVRLVQFPAPGASAPKTPAETLAYCVDWRGIATSSHRPGLLPLLHENAKFLEKLTEGDGTAEPDAALPFSGKMSLKVTPPERGSSRIPGLRVPIRALPRLGEYRFISFAWKKTDGQDVALGLAHQGVLGGDNLGNRPRIRRDPNPLHRPGARARRPLDSAGRGLQYGYRYLRGRGNPDQGPAMKLDGQLPKTWQRVERDLFGDFGEFTLTGFSLLCPDGSAAWFDEIYLARDRQDLEHLPSRQQKKPPAGPNILGAETAPERYGLISRKAAPLFGISNANAGEGVQLLKEYQGRQNVLRTLPLNQQTPCVLRAAVVLPAGQKSRLELEVHRHAEGDWNLVVTANGEKLQETLINKDNAGEKWFQANVDLSKFAGQPLLLEIQNAANNWSHEEAYWGRVAIVQGKK